MAHHSVQYGNGEAHFDTLYGLGKAYGINSTQIELSLSAPKLPAATSFCAYRELWSVADVNGRSSCPPVIFPVQAHSIHSCYLQNSSLILAIEEPRASSAILCCFFANFQNATQNAEYLKPWQISRCVSL